MPHAERHQWSRSTPAWVGVLALAFLCGTSSLRGSEARFTPIVKAVERVQNSVVNVFGEKQVSPGQDGDGQYEDRRVNGMGTGVIVDPRGYIITNYHVVEGVEKINVTLADGSQTVAELVSFDFKTDLAVIKITTKRELPVIPIGRSDDLMRGETVIAVGNAFGYGHSVTTGIISALNRKVQVSEQQIYDDLIQTDASINPGNSGGPLINIDGEMIGINVAVRAGAQGIGFAIPNSLVTRIAADLVSSRRLQSTWHGATLRDAIVGDQRVVIVDEIEPQSPAQKAGLEPGDRVVKLDGVPVSLAMQFELGLLDRHAGDELRVECERGKAPMKVDLALATLPRSGATADDKAWMLLGLQLKPTSPLQFQKLSKRYRGGLTVSAVRDDSPAARQGIRAGDVLVGMHVWETVSVENVAYVLSRPDLNKINPLKFYVLRGEETLYGYLQVSELRPAAARR